MSRHSLTSPSNYINVISFLEDFKCVGVGGRVGGEISLKAVVAIHHLETLHVSLGFCGMKLLGFIL